MSDEERADWDLKIDPKRIGACRLFEFAQDGKERVAVAAIPVRAYDPIEKRWGCHDIAELDKESLLRWLRSRGGDNPFAEDVVGILLGHGHLHDLEPPK